MQRRFLVDEGLWPGILCLCALILFNACELLNPDEQIPSYVYIDKYRLETEFAEGSNSARITEAWFYANGEFLGAYDMPAKIPVLFSGLTEIRLFPGIKDNGIVSTPDIYPMFTTLTTQLDLEPARTDTIRPVARYSDAVKFQFIEGFESGHIFTEDLDDYPETRIVSSGVDVFEGTASGWIHLDTLNDAIEVATLNMFSGIPTNGSPVYLELNYKNDVPFSIGLIGNSPGLPPATFYAITLVPRDFWNKIYINLTGAVVQSDLQSYQVVLLASLGEGRIEADIFLDNIKFLHFE